MIPDVLSQASGTHRHRRNPAGNGDRRPAGGLVRAFRRSTGRAGPVAAWLAARAG